MTRAPWSAAQMVAATMSLVAAAPSLLEVMRMGMRRQFMAGAATPTPLLLAAAAVPATQVPCGCTGLVLLLLSTTFHPGTSWLARSGCVASMPVSQTARMICELPVVIPQAVAALMVARCHSELYSGSLGVRPAGKIK